MITVKLRQTTLRLMAWGTALLLLAGCTPLNNNLGQARAGGPSAQTFEQPKTEAEWAAPDPDRMCVWWSEAALFVLARKNAEEPERLSRLIYSDKIEMHLLNWSGFDALRQETSSLEASLILEQDLSTAVLGLQITTPGPDTVSGDRPITRRVQKLSVRVDYATRELTDYSSMGMTLFESSSFHLEWLCGRLVELRDIALDIGVNDSRYGIPLELRPPAGMSFTFEESAGHPPEEVVVNLLQEPQAYFLNPRELTAAAGTWGSLELSTDLSRGVLTVTGSEDGADGEIITEQMTLDFRTGRFSREASLGEHNMLTGDLPLFTDSALLALARAMRAEILQQIPIGVSVQRENPIVYSGE